MTRDQIKATIAITLAIGEAIRDLGEVPSGHLYAEVMSVISLEDYQAIIDSFKQGGIIKEVNHLLIWTGAPKAPAFARN